MKKIYILFIVSCIVSVSMSSCNKWLDVNSDLEFVEENLFEEAQGYYVTLNGLYIKMASTSLYGKELTWGAVEAWGKGYFNVSEKYNGTYYDLSQFNYESEGVKNMGSAIWLNCFKIVAEANNLIQNLEEDQKVQFPDGDVTKNMILGEAYAIRALMHFEIVRIFAQAPVLDQGGVTAYVPFVDKFPSKVNVPLPTKEVLARIISDLEKAKELVRPFDTESPNPGYTCYQGGKVGDRLQLDVKKKDTDEETSDDAHYNFLGYRAHRLGYYPIVQLLARVSLYAGDNDKAFENANEIVTLVDKKTPYSFINPNYIGDPSDLDVVQPRLHAEIMFGIYNSKLKDEVIQYFKAPSVKFLTFDRVVWTYLFKTNPDDCRAKAIPGDVCTKYVLDGKNEDQMVSGQSLVSVLRFPECFYIAAESIFDKDEAKAIEIFNKVVEARNNSLYKLNPGVLKTDFMDAIVQEYHREFISEGVMTFVYKRLNYPIFQNGAMVATNGKLVMPVPNTESGIY